ncbi:MAG: alanine--glyoxylate aminotransferase family protein [Candidatus Wallbacteria bacterium]|nr:alanine--glyoxylate aminotransferase family protein [Candidatus Wallbacteria bacterium]
MTTSRNRDTSVPFQGTVLLISSPGETAAERLERLLQSRPALRPAVRQVTQSDLANHRLAELASRVAEVNPCVILAAGSIAADAAARWAPYYPPPAPAVVRLASTEKGPLKLEAGGELESWLDGGAWRSSAAGSRLGVRDGRAVEGAQAALGTLTRLAPAAVELLLGYAKPFPGPGSDALGSAALRLGDTVYPCNLMAVRGVEPALLQPVSLADYLYGTRSALIHVEVSETIGACYARNVLGLRLFGVSRAARERMAGELARMNDDWLGGRLVPGRIFDSSAMLAARALEAGGWAVRAGWPRGPLDLFLRLRALADRAGGARVLVHYRRVSASQSLHREDAFPWRLLLPWTDESLRRRLETEAELRLEAAEDGSKMELDARAFHWSSSVPGDGRVMVAPGPAPVRAAVHAAGARALTHREPAFSALFEDVTRKLLGLVGAGSERHQPLLLAGSGSAAVEASVESMARLGRLVVVSNGQYGDRLAQLASTYAPGASHVVEFAPGTPVDGAVVRKTLKSQRSASVFLLAAHHETGTGMLNDVEELSAICKETGAAFFVDAVGSLGAHCVDLPGLGIALLAGAPDMALGGTPGVSFVIGERQLFRRLQSTQPRVRYLDLSIHYKLAVERAQMPNTPALQALMGLATALGDLLSRGPDGVAAELARRAAALRRSLLTLGFQFPVEMRLLSSVLTPILMPPGVAAADLHEALLARGCVTERSGPPHAENGLLIGHAGALSAGDLARFLEVVEAELHHLQQVPGAAQSPRSVEEPGRPSGAQPAPPGAAARKRAWWWPAGTFASSGK